LLKRIFKPSQFKKNIISGSFIYGLNIIIVLISYPIYIKYLGFELFSIWSALSVVIAFAKMGEFGISKAIIVYVSKAQEGENEIRKIIYNAFYILTFVSIIILLLLVLLKSSIVGILNIPPDFVNESISIIPLLGISIILFLFYDMFSGVIAGKNRLDVVNILLLINNIIKVIISVVLLAMGLSLMAIIYSIIITNLLLIFVQIFLIIFKFKIPIYRPAKLEKIYLSKLIGYGSSIMGMQFFNMLSVPLVKVILSNTIGIESVGIFELAQRSSYSIRTLFEKGLFAIMPDISILSSQDKENANKRVKARVSKIFKALLIFSVPFFLIISALAPFWLKLWLGKSYSLTILYGYWLLQPGIIVGLLILPYYYALLGTYNQRYCLYETILRAIVTVLLCSLFFVLELNIYYSFAFISMSVVISNMLIIWGYRKQIIMKQGL